MVAHCLAKNINLVAVNFCHSEHFKRSQDPCRGPVQTNVEAVFFFSTAWGMGLQHTQAVPNVPDTEPGSCVC